MIKILIDAEGTRLGNWLFQYAYVKTRHPNAKIQFCVSGSRYRHELESYKELWPEVEYSYDRSSWGEIDIKSLCQDWRKLDESIVRRSIHCPQNIRNNISKKWGHVLSEGAIGISVRRGDYLKLPHRHPFVGKRFLRDAIDSLATTGLKNYIVCSDDIAWCRKFFGNLRSIYYVEGEDVLTQLFLQAECRHNIISNSTFSWWGGYLNRNPSKRVIFPSRWFGMDIKEKNPLERFMFKGGECIKSRYEIGILLRAYYMMIRWALGRRLRTLGLIK